MLYEIAHLLRDKMPYLWSLVDLLNSFLFSLRYGFRLKNLEKSVIENNGGRFLCGSSPMVAQNTSNNLLVSPIREVLTGRLVEFFARQPEEAYKFFRPHGFDERSIKKLQSNKSFIAYVIIDGDNIAGYCFIRSFFVGKGFRGRMVDIDYRGRGLGTMMNRLLNDVGFSIGLRLFETVNKDNVASYRSALSASNVKIIEEMGNGDLYLEVLKKDS